MTNHLVGNPDCTIRWLWVALIILCPVVAGAEIYKWTGDQGKVHFGDRPPPIEKAEPVELRINSYQVPEIYSPGAPEATHVRPEPRRRRAKPPKVVMYSAAWCGVCQQAKTYFRAHTIRFTEYDVETSEKGKRDYRRLTGRGVPIILVGGRRMNGFSPGLFE